jgi:ribokinase
VAAARLGALVEFVGCLGDDAFGDALLGGLRREGVGTAHVRRLPDTASGTALIQVDAAGENAITVVPGANGQLDRQLLLDAAPAIRAADVVLLQLEIPYDTVVEAIRMAAEAGVRVVLDPAPAPSDGLPPALFGVDVLSPNQSEATLLTGIEVYDLEAAARAAARLQMQGVRRVVIKLGADGAFCVDEQGASYRVPAYPTTVVDTTAAGDAFTAALALGLAEGMPMEAAARFGCAAGAQAVSRPGAQEAMPRRKEVEGKMLSPG